MYKIGLALLSGDSEEAERNDNVVEQPIQGVAWLKRNYHLANPDRDPNPDTKSGPDPDPDRNPDPHRRSCPDPP